jgi:hypothetical protein
MHFHQRKEEQMQKYHICSRDTPALTPQGSESAYAREMSLLPLSSSLALFLLSACAALLALAISCSGSGSPFVSISSVLGRTP